MACAKSLQVSWPHPLQLSSSSAVSLPILFSDARIFFTANNLFLFTNYPGNNPDAGVRGGTELNNDDESYPVPRTLAVGIKLNL